MVVWALFAVSSCWTAWIMRSSLAARWMRICAPVCVLLIVAVNVYWRWKIDALMTSPGETPAERQQRLAHGLANAYSVWGIGHAVALLLLGVMTAMMLRRRARTRSIAKPA